MVSSLLTSTGVLETPVSSKADIGTYMQNKRYTYSVRCLHFKNVAPNLLFVWCETCNYISDPAAWLNVHFLAERLVELMIEVFLNVSINLVGDLSLIES